MKTKSDIFHEMLDNETVKGVAITEELTLDIAKSIVDIPTYEKLSNAYLKKRINAYMGKPKDKDGVRIYLSDGSNYVNVDKEKSAKVLGQVKKQLSKKYKGLNKSISKVEKLRQIAAGQLMMSGLDVAINQK